MTRHTRLITALLSLIFCVTAFSAFSATVYAEAGYEDGAAAGGDSSDVPVVPAEPVEPEQPVYTEAPYVEPDPEPYVEPTYYVDPYQGDNQGGNQGNNDYNTDNNSDDNSNYNQSDSNTGEDVYYDSDGNTYSDQSEVYVGGGQTYDPPVSTAPSAPLIKSDDKVDVNELSKNDWNDIKASLSKAGAAGGDGDDFAFIQRNTSTGDNGHTIFIIGIALIIISIAGFTYLIASAVMRRKKLSRKGAASHSSADSGSQPRFRSDSDYDDGFKTEKHGSRYSGSEKSKSSGSKGGKRYR